MKTLLFAKTSLGYNAADKYTKFFVGYIMNLDPNSHIGKKWLQTFKKLNITFEVIK